MTKKDHIYNPYVYLVLVILSHNAMKETQLSMPIYTQSSM